MVVDIKEGDGFKYLERGFDGKEFWKDMIVVKDMNTSCTSSIRNIKRLYNESPERFKFVTNGK